MNGGGPDWLGYPRSDEYPWHGNCGEWFGAPYGNATTNFQDRYITYNCSTNSWQSSAYSWLQNPSFENGNAAYWNRLHANDDRATYPYAPTPPGGGTWWLEFNPGPNSVGSSFQDVPRDVKPGDTFHASVYVRCPWAGGNCTYNLAIRGLEQDAMETFSTGNNELTDNGAWVPVSLSGTFSGFHNKIRFEVYTVYNSNNHNSNNLDMDLASLGP